MEMWMKVAKKEMVSFAFQLLRVCVAAFQVYAQLKNKKRIV